MIALRLHFSLKYTEAIPLKDTYEYQIISYDE